MRAVFKVDKKLYESVKVWLEFNPVETVQEWTGLSRNTLNKIDDSISYRQYSARRNVTNKRILNWKKKIKVTHVHCAPVEEMGVMERIYKFLFK